MTGVNSSDFDVVEDFPPAVVYASPEDGSDGISDLLKEENKGLELLIRTRKQLQRITQLILAGELSHLAFGIFMPAEVQPAGSVETRERIGLVDTEILVNSNYPIVLHSNGVANAPQLDFEVVVREVNYHQMFDSLPEYEWKSLTDGTRYDVKVGERLNVVSVFMDLDTYFSGEQDRDPFQKRLSFLASIPSIDRAVLLSPVYLDLLEEH